MNRKTNDRPMTKIMMDRVTDRTTGKTESDRQIKGQQTDRQIY